MRRASWCLFGVLALLVPAAADGQQHAVVVYTKDAGVISGRLLQILPAGVRVDPDGRVAMLLIDAGRIDSVRLTQLRETLLYPLALENIPRGLPTERITDSGDFSGFPTLALAGSAGFVSAGIPEEKEYYEGFSGGPAFQARARIFLPDADRRSSRLFLGLSYYYSALEPELQEFVIDDVSVQFSDLDVHHWGLELGLTSRMSRGESYAFVLMGVARLKNSIEVSGQIRPGATAVINVNDWRTALRFEVGGVIGLTPRLGILLSGGGDFLIAGVEKDIIGRTEPVTDGLLPSVSVGLTIDLFR